MFIQVRNNRGRLFGIEVGPEWVLDDLAKTYNRLIGARKYEHHFVLFPRMIVKAGVLIVDQIKEGQILDVANIREKDVPVEVNIVFNRNEANEEKILIYADQTWSVEQLKQEIRYQKRDENESIWELPAVWRKFTLKLGSITLEDRLVLRDYCLQDCTVFCDPLTTIIGMIMSRIRALMLSYSAEEAPPPANTESEERGSS